MAESKGDGGGRGFWARSRLALRGEQPEPAKSEDLVAQVLTVGDIFSGRFRFRLTCFQRAYAWRVPHVERLLDDISKAMQRPDGRRRYCLGRVVLAQTPGRLDTELVDGHQRLMTLTILLAVLRDLETVPEQQEWLHSFIADDESKFAGLSYRISPQVALADMFEQTVQEQGATDSEPRTALDELSEPEFTVIENRDYVLAILSAKTIQERRELAEFLIYNCRLIGLICDDQADAWAMISVEQETRLEFSDADQAKAILLSEMPVRDRVTCGRAWEGCEALLAANDMYRLLSHIRAVAWRGRTQSNAPVEADVAQHFNLARGGFDFMSSTFVPMAERLSELRRGAVSPDPLARDAIAASIKYMTWVDPHGWVPAALQWITLRGPEAPEAVMFFSQLERLWWIMKLAGVDPQVQETRMLALLDQIESGGPVATFSKLTVERKLLTDAVTNLRSPGIAAKSHCGLVLRRLSIAMGKDCGPIVRSNVTMEHILPRNPKGGYWRRHFRSEADVKAYAQRLGNVTWLSEAHNQEAANKEWPVKRLILASSSFVLSRKAAAAEDWTPRTIADRTEELIALLFKQWGIDL